MRAITAARCGRKATRVWAPRKTASPMIMIARPMRPPNGTDEAQPGRAYAVPFSPAPACHHKRANCVFTARPFVPAQAPAHAHIYANAGRAWAEQRHSVPSPLAGEGQGGGYQHALHLFRIGGA